MKRILIALFALLTAMPVLSQAQRNYSQPELEQMLAPIALYPDPLLSQILMASTYPVEVVEAARWTRANPGLQGDAAVQAVEREDWDPSVKSLVAFPQILQRMDENLEWTRSLGDAFLGQQPYVMETVQQLRQRAQAAGNLQSNGQLAVQQQGQAIYIYDPYVVYGAWRYPAYRPVVWAPWPGYVRPARPGLSISFSFGAPIALSRGFFFGGFDWPRRTVSVVNPRSYYYRPPVVVNRTVVVDRGSWQHDSYHRRGAADRGDRGYRGDTRATQVVVPERREVPAERREHRYQRPPGRDLQDSRVLTPRSAQPPRMPAAAAQGTPQAQHKPQPHAQPRAQPAQQARERPQRVAQEARHPAREQRQERRQEARAERSQGRGGPRS
jgi:hypothetical protein